MSIIYWFYFFVWKRRFIFRRYLVRVLDSTIFPDWELLWFSLVSSSKYDSTTILRGIRRRRGRHCTLLPNLFHYVWLLCICIYFHWIHSWYMSFQSEFYITYMSTRNQVWEEGLTQRNVFFLYFLQAFKIIISVEVRTLNAI